MLNKSNSKVEMVANVILIFIGLALGIILYFPEETVRLSPIFLSIAIACIIYQFLGGISETNSFSIVGLKLGGAAAVLLGSAWLLANLVLPHSDETILQGSLSDWIPISRTNGKIMPVSLVRNGKHKLFPDSTIIQDIKEDRKKTEYEVFLEENNRLNLVLKSKHTDTIGYINASSIQRNGFFNQTIVDDSENAIKVFTLRPDVDSLNSSKDIPGTNLPFEIKVHDISRFSIEPYIYDYEVRPRESYIIPLNKKGEFYIVFLEQANNIRTDSTRLYSKWLVRKFKNTLKPLPQTTILSRL